jgi:hypothetical protein
VTGPDCDCIREALVPVVRRRAWFSHGNSIEKAARKAAWVVRLVVG